MVTNRLSARPGRFFLFAFLAVLFISASLIYPTNDALAARKGVLWVKVVNIKSRAAISEVQILFKGTGIDVMTDRAGEVGVELDAGTYSISLLKDGYYNSVYQNVEVEAGKASTVECELMPGNSSEQFYFGIGGINIISKRELLPKDLETVHEISGAEIEHHLSTNLGDVLDLIPGVERTNPPGLADKSQVNIRGAALVGGGDNTQNSSAALFGTKVIVDDIPLSNNANLQRGTGTTFGETSQVSGSGIDLRGIPADNVEKVEVVTGVPSVEYGDLTTGLVKVTTKKEQQPHRIKLKSNPDTKEANMSGGLSPGGIGVSYNLNYAYSERDIRREGDEYSRYSGQVTVRKSLLNDKLSLLNKVYYTGVLDETNLNQDDPLSVEQYNDDKTYIYGLTADYRLGPGSRLFFSGNVKYTKRDSYYQKLTGADTRVLTDATDPGTNEGIFQVGSYLFQIWTKGEEWSADTKLNYTQEFELLGLGHELLAGTEYSFDNNVGEGKIFDPLKPPYGNLGYRPLPFDASPALYTANAYFEDEISGLFLKRPYIVNAGFRYEMYRPLKINLAGIFNDEGIVESKNGTFFLPRVRLRYDLFKNTRMRFGWGRSAKMPSMTTIFQGPEYIDIVEENISPPDSVPLVSTYVFNNDNPRLIGYEQEKSELSIDQQIGSVGMGLTGFYSHSDGIPRSLRTPLVLYRYRWNGWPDPDTRTVIDTFYTEPDNKMYTNVGKYKNYGVEFLVTTRRISKLSTIFKMTMSFVKSRSGAEGTYMSSARLNQTLGRTVYPFYAYTESWSRKMIVNYSADWFFKKAGLWTTFFLQQTLYDANQRYDDPYVYATSYYDPVDNRVVKLTPAGSDSLGMTKPFDDQDLMIHRRPNDRLLFNVNVTKSLGRGAELSLFVHNVFDDAAYYIDDDGLRKSRNHNIFYGVEVSMDLNKLVNR